MDTPDSAIREFHQTGSVYMLPNDAAEHARLREQGDVYAKLIGGTFMTDLSSLKNPSKVVDVGCGTGDNTLKLAKSLPSSTVYGVDVSPIPAAAQEPSPANITWVLGSVFEADDERPKDSIVREIFAPGQLDFIFSRMLILGMDDWPRYLSIIARALKPGGIVEIQEPDFVFYCPGEAGYLHDNWEWYRIMVAGMRKKRLSIHAGSKVAQHMKNAGLEVIKTQSFDSLNITRNSGDETEKLVAPPLKLMANHVFKNLSIAEDEGQRLLRLGSKDLMSEGVCHRYTVTIGRKI